MYNTVGETAGVTQDVGSDPTVGEPDDSYCCTLCGMELGEEGRGEEMATGEERAGEQKGASWRLLDLSEMSGMEDGDEEMDGEPDTTGGDQAMTTSHYGGEQGDAQERSGGRIPHPMDPERQTS